MHLTQAILHVNIRLARSFKRSSLSVFVTLNLGLQRQEAPAAVHVFRSQLDRHNHQRPQVQQQRRKLSLPFKSLGKVLYNVLSK
jgi:hypothetical protein